jgi:hypothetical protein
MLTCLEEYRLVAGSLPLSQKEEVQSNTFFHKLLVSAHKISFPK